MSRPLQRSLLAAFAGLIGYGAWAFYINQSAGVGMGLRAAALQGGYSFVLTLGMTLVTEALYQRLPRKHAHWLTIALTSCATWCVAFGIHLLNGTPNIIPTILPGFIIGIAYTSVYVAALRTGERLSSSHQQSRSLAIHPAPSPCEDPVTK